MVAKARRVVNIKLTTLVAPKSTSDYCDGIKTAGVYSDVCGVIVLFL